jgi:putative oxidoreductase
MEALIELFVDFFSVTMGWGDYVFHRFFLLFISLFFTILFLQSGIDKIVSFSGNLNYFKDHFKNTFFRNHVKFLLLVITLLECVTGCLFLYCCVATIWSKSFFLLGPILIYFLAICFALLTLSCLFLGQRLAQDYAGAVNLGIYFLIALVGLSLPLFFLEIL